MATIMHLPDEVIVIILKNKSIEIKDISSFKSTCKRFAQITLNNEFWKEKYCQRCSIARKRYRKLKRTFNHLNVEEQIKSGIQCIKKLRHYVLSMSYKALSETDREQLNRLLYFIVENSIVYYFVWDELNRIISVELLLESSQGLFRFSSVSNSNCFTNKYCFSVIFYCLKKYRLLYKLFKFLNKPKEKQIVERQLLIIAQRFLPHLPYSVVNTWLDNITQEALSRLKHKYPMHSIFSIPLEQFSVWRDNNITENFWNPTEASRILRTVQEYIFSDLEIHKLCELWMIPNFEAELNKCSFSDQTVVLTVIYYIVIRRLGIKDCILNVRMLHFPENNLFYQTEELQFIWKPKYEIHWDTHVHLSIVDYEDKKSDLNLSIMNDKYSIFLLHTFDVLKEKKLNFSIYFD